MSDYIRRRATGATYFFTLRLADRNGDLLIREVDQLRRAMRDTLASFAFHIDAITVLPAALHMIWTLPSGDSRYAARIAMLKSRFSRAMPMPEHRTLAQIKRAEKGIWQRRYWEHQIRDAADFARHRDMIYLSPVLAGLSATPQGWTHIIAPRSGRGRAPACPVGLWCRRPAPYRATA